MPGDAGLVSIRSSARRAVLWVTPKWPLPAEDGARLATGDLLRAAARRDDVHLLALVGRDERWDIAEAREVLGIRSACALRRADAGRGAGRFVAPALRRPLLPLSVAPYAQPPLQRDVRAFLDEHRGFHVTVFDGLHGAGALAAGARFQTERRLGEIVYRAHNVESDLWRSSVTRARSPLRRAALAVQAGLVGAFEGSLVRAAGRVLCVSSDDARSFRALFPDVPEGRLSVVPIGMRFDERPPAPPSGTLRLLFLGRLDWPPNREGLSFLLREVWPVVAVARPDLALDVAGSGDAAWLGVTVAGLPARDRVRLLGRVDDTTELYRAAALTLVPLFHGSGTRVKVLEAARHGRAALSTALGVQGLGLQPGRSYLRAESASDFIRALVGLTPEACRRAGEAAFHHMRAHADSAVCAARFEEVLADLAPRRAPARSARP